MCMYALPLVKCTRPLADSILLSRLALSLSLPPPPPPPVSDLSFPSLCYNCLASVKQTHHQDRQTETGRETETKRERGEREEGGGEREREREREREIEREREHR